MSCFTTLKLGGFLAEEYHCVMELRKEIAMFLCEKKNKLVDHFNDNTFIISLGYLADFFSHLNMSLQGILRSWMRERRLPRFVPNWNWIKRASKQNYCNFPTLEDTIKSDEGAETHQWIRKDIIDHLIKLVQEFEELFLYLNVIGIID